MASLRTKPEHRAGSDGGDDVDDGHKASLERTCGERGFDSLETLAFESTDFVVFAREGFDDADGRDDLRYDRDHAAFLLADFTGGLLHLAGVGVDDEKERRHNGQRDQGELPVDAEHHDDHAE